MASPPGRQLVRLVRQRGANVTGAVSAIRAATVLPARSARGEEVVDI